MHLLNLIFHPIHRVIVIACMALLLAGCPGLIPQDSNDDASASSYFYLDKIAQSSGSTQVDYQILASRALLREGNITRAEQLLNSLPKTLSEHQLREGFLLTGEIEIAKRNPAKAQVALNKLVVSQLTRKQQARYYQVQIEAANKSDILSQLRGYVMLEQVIDSDKHQQVIDNSWNLLSSLSASTLNSLTLQTNETTLQGWLDLVRVYAANRHEVAKLQTAIQSWQQQYPQNPYSKTLPTRLSGVLGFETLAINQVALLLPLEGQAQNFSQAVQAGFNAAMQMSGNTNTQITVHDTTKQSTTEIIKAIELTGVPTMIVGPLLKDDVNQAVTLNTNLTVLTLNKPDQIKNQLNMCYFALSPEDEAIQAAQYMFANNHLTPLIIAPRTELGQRMAKAFDQEWAKINGRGALVQYFNNAHDLKESMNHRQGIRLVGSSVVTGQTMEGARVDSVYVIANQEELGLIKAMIDMVGTRMPPTSMYASSRSNQAGSGPDFRLEMEGVRFSEIPLLAGADSKVYQTAAREVRGDYSQMRLYAFGMDAWKLVNSLAEIRKLPNYEIKGYTGTLSASNDCVINRDLTWLQYRQGGIVAAR